MGTTPGPTDTADMTKTEELLREAQAICQRVTNREDVSDDLLCAVYRSLELEQDLDAEDAADAADALESFGALH